VSNAHRLSRGAVSSGPCAAGLPLAEHSATPLLRADQLSSKLRRAASIFTTFNHVRIINRHVNCHIFIQHSCRARINNHLTMAKRRKHNNRIGRRLLSWRLGFGWLRRGVFRRRVRRRGRLPGFARALAGSMTRPSQSSWYPCSGTLILPPQWATKVLRYGHDVALDCQSGTRATAT
jgi:hypothetical protein